MLLSSTPLISTLRQSLNWLSLESRVIAENLARADIPGEFKRELKPFQQIASKPHSVQMMPASEGKSMTPSHSFKLTGQQVTQTREEISKETESMRLTESSMKYQEAMSIYRKYAQMFKTVMTTNKIS